MRIWPVFGAIAVGSSIAAPLSLTLTYWMPDTADHSAIIAVICDSKDVSGTEVKPPPGDISILIELTLLPGHAVPQ